MPAFKSLVRLRNKSSFKPDLELQRCPYIEIDRLDLADVSSHGPVNTRASDAQKYATSGILLTEPYGMRFRTHIFHEAQRGSSNPYERGMVWNRRRRTVSFAIGTDFIIWLFEQLAESPCVRFCRLLVLIDHRWQMEVGSEVCACDQRTRSLSSACPCNLNYHPLTQVRSSRFDSNTSPFRS